MYISNLKSSPFIIYIFIAFCALSSSCTTYKTFEVTKNDIKSTKTYKITDNVGKVTKAKACKKNEDSLLCKDFSIDISKVVKIKERRFSLLKTGSLITSAGIAGVAIIVVYESKINIDIEGPNYN